MMSSNGKTVDLRPHVELGYVETEMQWYKGLLTDSSFKIKGLGCSSTKNGTSYLNKNILSYSL